MAQYDIPTPNTLLFRTLPGDRASAALRLLDEHASAAAPPGVLTVCTLADVTSGPAAAPVAACAVSQPPGSLEAWIDRFVVAVPFRGRGLARRLIAETATHLRANGVRRVFVRAAPDDRLLRLLVRAGVMSDAGPFGQWWDHPGLGNDGASRSWLVSDL